MRNGWRLRNTLRLHRSIRSQDDPEDQSRGSRKPLHRFRNSYLRYRWHGNGYRQGNNHSNRLRSYLRYYHKYRSYKEEQSAINDKERLSENDIDAYILKMFDDSSYFSFGTLGIKYGPRRSKYRKSTSS